jgi:hypothetical protein
MARFSRCSAILCAFAAAGALSPVGAQSVTFGGVTYSNRGLFGAGRVNADKRDKLNETFGSLSGLAIDPRTWRRNADGSYAGTLYSQPDRGYAKSGVTTNYRPRRQKFELTFKPDLNGASKQDQLGLALSETLLLTEGDGRRLTSLDPTVTGSGTRTGLPALRLPQAHTGDLTLDAEGFALLPDGTFFVSDEYGPYLYRFSAAGTLLGAIRPPDAFIPRRNAQESFSSDSPAAGQPSPTPSQPDAGRGNSQGLEGLSVSADGRTLFALMQSALRQDGGAGDNSLRRYTRLLAYNITNPAVPTLSGEWILPLPIYTQSGAQQVASVGDLVALGNNRFLVLTRDGNGRGADTTRSIYRAVLIYDTTNATNIVPGGIFDNINNPAAPNGILAAAITPATSAVLIDINDATQLAKFDLNNSANANSETLAEKWESLALVPALDPAAPDDFFLLIGNDNDFSTTDGFQQDGGSYKAGLNIDTMVLAYRVSLPGTSTLPNITTQPASRTVLIGQAASFTAAAMGYPSPTLQWSRNGVAISGATSATLNLASVQAGDAGTYTLVASNSVGGVTSLAATLVVNGANAPAFTAQPTPQILASGSTIVFTATATNAPSYQWQRDGIALADATNRMLVIANAGPADAGTYAVIATNPSGLVVSDNALLTVVNVAAAELGRLINLSILTNVTASEPVFTVGTVLGGTGTSGSKALLVRAAGPSLTQFAVTGFLSDPTMTLVNTSTNPGTTVALNNDWGGTAALSAAFAQVGAFAYVGPTSKDAALFQPILAPANYTVQVSGVGGATGTVIAELYDATPAGAHGATTPRLINVSVLKQIPSGSTLTAGFYVGGSTSKSVLIRAIGPGLTQFGVGDSMPDPQVALFNASSSRISENDNWGGDPQLTAAGTAVAAFAVGDPTSKDAMLLVTLAPGAYTVQVTGVNNTGGRAIVEVYELP